MRWKGACLPASGAASEVPPLLMHPPGGGGRDYMKNCAAKTHRPLPTFACCKPEDCR